MRGTTLSRIIAALSAITLLGACNDSLSPSPSAPSPPSAPFRSRSHGGSSVGHTPGGPSGGLEGEHDRRELATGWMGSPSALAEQRRRGGHRRQQR